MTVFHKLFKLLSGHDVADGQTDGRTPYHNASEVLLRAYKKDIGCIHTVERLGYKCWGCQDFLPKLPFPNLWVASVLELKRIMEHFFI